MFQKIDYNIDYTKLSIDDEKTLIKQARNGDAVAQNQLINSIMPLIIRMARTFKAYTSAHESDLVNSGVLGAIGSIKKYDMNSENKWSTYTMFRFGEVRRAMDECMESEHLITRSTKERQYSAKKKHIGNTDVPENAITETRLISIHAPIRNGGSYNNTTFGDSLYNEPEEHWGSTSIPMSEMSVEDLCETLDEEQKTLLSMLAMGATTREIGDILNFSRTTTTNKTRRVIAELREQLFNRKMIDGNAFAEPVEFSGTHKK